MSKFRKKPVEIDAEQFFASQDPETYPPELFWWPNGGCYTIPLTDTTCHVVKDGDWIITYSNGTKSVCNSEEFKVTYEKVEDK
jgi:hypothetical protein